MKRVAISVAAGALGIVLAGCGGGGGTTASTTTAGPTTTGAATTTAAAPATAPATTTAEKPVQIDIVIKGGKPVGGIARATVKKGQSVAIVVHSDVADEVHVHGYDYKADVTAGGSVRITFPAVIQGVFEGELEHRGLQILELTVK